MPDHSALPSIAVIADAHFHDLDANYGFAGLNIGSRRMTVRSWAESRQSTRVFNESVVALHAALERVIERGIHHVVLLGDYSDDGQRGTMAGLQPILSRFAQEHDVRFYALPGNHDIFGPQGRHHTKQFIQKNGARIKVSSQPKQVGVDTGDVAAMYCEGYPIGLMPMARFGYYRHPADLHWETPFGLSDRNEDRMYEVASVDGRNRYRLMDASYLVEPAPGLWLLMIDANVFEPRDGEAGHGEEASFIDSTAAGWNAMLRCKPFVLRWMADVAERARAQNKTLLAFSHYPALDPFDGVTAAERALFGETNVVRRTPVSAVAEAFAAAGISIHFSGHLHVEGLTRHRSHGREVVNIAVPSLVAFAPGFKTVDFASESLTIGTVRLDDLPLDQDVLTAYAREAAFAGEAPHAAFSAGNYGGFLLAHQDALVRYRYFEKEWPKEIAAQLSPLKMREICALFAGNATATDELKLLANVSSLALQELEALSLIEIAVDWYSLRQASQLALDVVAVERRKLYRALAERYGRSAEQGVDGSAEAFLAVFLGAFTAFLDRADQGRSSLQLPR